MQSVFVIITKLIASKHYFCKEVFCNNFGRDGSRDLKFLSATRSRMEMLTKENVFGAKTAPTAISRTSTPLLRATRFP